MNIKDIYDNTPPPQKSRRDPVKITLVVILILGLLAGIFVGGYYAGFVKNGVSDAGREILENMPYLEKAYKALKENYLYYENLSWEEFQIMVVQGMLNNIDPYTFLTYTDDYSAHQATLGITFHKTQYNEYIVSRVGKGSPADLAGIKRGDKVYEVNGVRIENMEYASASEYLKGENLELGIIRQDANLKYTGAVEKVSVTKKVFSAPKAWYENVDQNTGLIVFTEFQETAFEDFLKAADDFVASGRKKLILDLRGNGGGSLDILTKIAPILVKSQENNFDLYLTELEYRDGTSYTYGTEIYKNSDGAAANGYLGDRVGEGYELAVLSDGGTASASEILIAAIKYYGTGVQIGEKTYGKGVAQTLVKLNETYLMYITAAKFYVKEWQGESSVRVNLHQRGIAPSPELVEENMPITSDFSKDKGISRAMEIFAYN